MKIVITTYSDGLTENFSDGTALLMESPFYRSLFPGTVLRRKTRRKLETTMGGERFATTVGGATTGFGGDLLIADDPLNASNAYSEAIRNQAGAYCEEVLVTRADKQTTLKAILVMQRLHEDDPAGRMLAKGGWNALTLQARATEAVDIPLLSGRVHKVQLGDLLQASRTDDAALEALRLSMGTANFEAQFQQNPLPAEGNLIKAEWLKRYSGLAPRGEVVVQSWDVAQKQGVANDYSVCTTWHVVNGIGYLVDRWRGKVEFPELVARTIDLYNQYRPSHRLIEDAGSGTALLQSLRSIGMFNAIARKPKGDKVSRAEAASGAFEAGRVLLPSDVWWLGEYKTELLGFPNVRHDDQVDSTTQFILWLNDHYGSTKFVVDWM